MQKSTDGNNLRLEVPEVVVARLPIYLMTLGRMHAQGLEVASSQELGAKLRITPAQIRKDLSYFGRFGKQGRGYNVSYLLLELRRILKLDQEWGVALVGVGQLGRAILAYQGFQAEGFKVTMAFDADSRKVGEVINEVVVSPMSALPQMLYERQIRLAIVAVPSSETQAAVDVLVGSGIRAILNYASHNPNLPPGVRVSNIDPVLALQGMTYYLKEAHEEPH